MTEQEQKIGDYISNCVNRQSFTVKDMEQVLALFKEALPELAKKAGWFQEEADLVGRLIDRGWIPPEEVKMKRWVKLADDQSQPVCPYGYNEASYNRGTGDMFGDNWRKIKMEVK